MSANDMSGMEIGLVSCTKSKQDHPQPPQDLYMESTFFKKARAHCEANHDQWYILSAKHHLLAPDGPPIDPYNETLSGARVAKRREWAETTVEEMRSEGLFENGPTFVIHTGKDYYGELLPRLPDNVSVRIPTEGLAQGEKLAWYNDHL
jgi:hypothetical protein